MKVQISAQAYHLRYVPEEDRILLLVELSSSSDLAMPMTRRLTRNLITALAKLVAGRTQAGLAGNPLARDTVLNFEYSQSVAQAIAQGNMRDESREKEVTVSSKPVREVNIVPKSNGDVALVFDNTEQALTLEVSADRIHIVISTFVRMAERAEWNFPAIASWLDAPKDAGDATARVVN